MFGSLMTLSYSSRSHISNDLCGLFTASSSLNSSINPLSRHPGRPLCEFAPTTCIFTSLDELPPSLERSCTSTTRAPCRAAAIAAQTPANPPPATRISVSRSTSRICGSGDGSVPAACGAIVSNRSCAWTLSPASTASEYPPSEFKRSRRLIKPSPPIITPVAQLKFHTLHWGGVMANWRAFRVCGLCFRPAIQERDHVEIQTAVAPCAAVLRLHRPRPGGPRNHPRHRHRF